MHADARTSFVTADILFSGPQPRKKIESRIRDTWDKMVGAESPAVGAVVLLDKDGERIAGNYFEDQFRALSQQQVC